MPWAVLNSHNFIGENNFQFQVGVRTKKCFIHVIPSIIILLAPRHVLGTRICTYTHRLMHVPMHTCIILSTFTFTAYTAVLCQQCTRILLSLWLLSLRWSFTAGGLPIAVYPCSCCICGHSRCYGCQVHDHLLHYGMNCRDGQKTLRKDYWDFQCG